VASATNSRKPQDAAAGASGGAIGDNSSTLRGSFKSSNRLRWLAHLEKTDGLPTH
jgi:hypothetical protein